MNLSIELCAGKITFAESPQRWDGKATKSGNKSEITFEFHPDRQPITKPKKFYGGTIGQQLSGPMSRNLDDVGSSPAPTCVFL